MWSLMCPNECPGLTDTYGAEFEQLYLFFEAKGRYRKQIPIKTLWDMITATQIETGKPYLMYNDHVNCKCNQNNLGVIKSSNLCVSGDTSILTDTGYFPIKSLVDCQTNVWNGSEWSQTVIRQTGANRKLYGVTMSNSSFLDCTGYHNFYVSVSYGMFAERRAMDLKPGDICEQVEYFPVASTNACTSNPQLDSENLRNDVIPFGFRIIARLLWLSRQLDEDAGYM